jgi:hypothetical protein
MVAEAAPDILEEILDIGGYEELPLHTGASLGKDL